MELVLKLISSLVRYYLLYIISIFEIIRRQIKTICRYKIWYAAQLWLLVICLGSKWVDSCLRTNVIKWIICSRKLINKTSKSKRCNMKHSYVISETINSQQKIFYTYYFAFPKILDNKWNILEKPLISS